MLFNNKKTTKPPEQQAQEVYRLGSIQAIELAIADTESKEDRAYTKGMIELAYILGFITMNERAFYTEQVIAKEKAERAKGEPVYKKKGVYEYNGYYILKDFDLEAEGKACWYIKQIGAEELIAKELSFKEAVRIINKR